MYLRQNILGQVTDVPENSQVVLETGSKKCGAGNQEDTVPEPDVSLKKRKIGEPDINPGQTSNLTTDTPKRGESEQGSSAGK